jgi:SAM-dependent methyltransferase
MEYAAFGGALRHRREAFLLQLGNPRRVLVLGDGDGRFLQAFAALYPQAQIDAVDVSAGMIALARTRAGRVSFHIADARVFPFAEYDLAVAHFFFDCFEDDELRRMLARIRTKSWLVSEFRNARWSWPILRGLYLLFRIATGLRTKKLPNHRTALESLGYRMDKEQLAWGGLLVSEMWVLL